MSYTTHKNEVRGEIWKNIQNYTGYKVSNQGRIMSLFHKRMLKLRPNNKGYLRTVLGRKSKNLFVHRLVAIHFIANPKGFPIIHHKDNDPTNNVVSNLEWCTQKKNIYYAHQSGRRKYDRLSGEKYVTWENQTKKWRVVIHNEDGTKSRLGRFRDMRAAIRVRNKALGAIRLEQVK